MENNYDQIRSSFGQKYLFGQGISLVEIISIISTYPASLWLDLFSKIEGFLVIPRKNILDIQVFLSGKIFPPSVISRIKRKNHRNGIYFSPGQLNLARKLAIAYGSTGNETEIPLVDISKVLLSSQDFHNEYDEAIGGINEFEKFCKFVVRNGYLNGSINSASMFIRANQMYIKEAKKLNLYPNKSFSVFFKEKVGLTVEESIALSFAIATPFFQTKETLWDSTATIDPRNYFGQVILDQKSVDSIIESLTMDFEKVKEDVLKELVDVDFNKSPVGYDLNIFRKAPLIRLSNGKLVCANLSCLLQKATQNSIWMPLKKINGVDRKTILNHLTEYRGALFEGYLRELCRVMTDTNKKIVFTYIPAEDTSDNEEVGDAILSQEDEIAIFEAKSRQFNELFKNTGDWDNDPYFIMELKKAASQIEIAAKKIIEEKICVSNINAKNIKRVYPIIVFYEPVPMHSKVQRFVRQTIKDAGYFSDSVFAPIEVIHIDDMENMLDINDSYTLIDLLRKKNVGNSHASESNFHNFLSNFTTSQTVMCNGWQMSQYNQLSKEIFDPIFKFKEIPNE